MKKDIAAFMRRIRSMSFARMEENISIIHRETGVSKAFIRADMINCALQRNVGYLDYRVFGFANNRSKENRATYMTMNHNSCLSKKLNDRSAISVFIDKEKFNEKFRSYIGRDYLFLPDCDARALKTFCSDKAFVFAKVTSSFGGQGIERLCTADISDYDALYNRLTEEKKFLLEEAIIQHSEMERLSPKSVNTLRIVTILHDGEAKYVYSLIRMGNGKNFVDNISSGGMYALLDDQGRISERAFCDKTMQFYECHPVSGVRFSDFTVPYFREAIEMCKQAATVEPRVGYVGWDAAITPDGPVLVEGNHLPSYEMCQNSGLNHSKIGILPRFEEILGKDFFV